MTRGVWTRANERQGQGRDGSGVHGAKPLTSFNQNSGPAPERPSKAMITSVLCIVATANVLHPASWGKSEGADCATSEESGGGSPWGVGGRCSGGAFIERGWTRKCVSRGMAFAWGGGVPSGGCRSATRSCCRHILRPCGHRCDGVSNRATATMADT